MPTIDLFVNSFTTRASADTYLEASARAADLWPLVAGVAKDRALISAFREFDRLRWDGTKTDVDYAHTAVVSAAGTGYSVDDIVTLVGGDGTAATFRVTAETGGAVDTVTVEDRGGYTTTPANPAATTGAGDDGLMLTVTYRDQTAPFPRTGLTDRDGNALSSTVIPADIISAQTELGFEISQDTAVEGGGGTGSNIKRVQAGPTEVEFFVGTDGTPFPKVVQDLISPFLGSAQGATAGSRSWGTDGESQFDTDDTFTKSQGFH